MGQRTMKALVTGGEGWIGQRVCAELDRRGYRLVRFDKQLGDDMHDGIPAAGCDWVFHLAAIPHPKRGLGWDDYYRANVDGTNTVARSAAAAGVKRFVYASSTAYYGAHTDFPYDPDVLVDPLAANAVQQYYGKPLPKLTAGANEAALYYAMSKVAAETVLAAWGMSGRLPVSVCRFHPSPNSRQPYDGLYMSPEDGARAMVDAAEQDTDSYTVRAVKTAR